MQGQDYAHFFVIDAELHSAAAARGGNFPTPSQWIDTPPQVCGLGQCIWSALFLRRQLGTNDGLERAHCELAGGGAAICRR